MSELPYSQRYRSTEPTKAVKGRQGKSLRTFQVHLLGKLPLENITEGQLSMDQPSSPLCPALFKFRAAHSKRVN